MKGLPFHTAPATHITRSRQNLSSQKVLTTNFGQITPIYCEHCIPGDIHNISHTCVVRMQPLIAPIMHEINVQTHWFFVPMRIMAELFDGSLAFDWEDYISGGKDGTDEQTEPLLTSYSMETWYGLKEKHLLSYLYNCFPRVPGPYNSNSIPNAWKLTAYNLIYNDYYRDENLEEEIGPLDAEWKNRAWLKDYFTSALPWQQRGVSPSIPMSATAQIELPDSYGFQYQPVGVFRTPLTNFVTQVTSPVGADNAVNNIRGTDNLPFPPGSPLNTRMDGSLLQWLKETLKIEVNPQIDFDINDLRTAWQTQRYLEALSRTGVRYTEYLKGIWGTAPTDERLQRPEFIGSTKQPVITSEVLNTNAEGTEPLGKMGGHGITAASTYVGRYRVREWGIIMGLLTIMPKPSYSQTLDRRDMTRTRFDYPNPFFMHLSERPIKMHELNYTGEETIDQEDFGFQGIWDEYRIKHDSINGAIHTYLNHYSLARNFPHDQPIGLTKEFIKCDGSAQGQLRRIFAVPSEDGFIVTSGTHNQAIRPIPFIAEPGLVDH